jgi:hypothetical protein
MEIFQFAAVLSCTLFTGAAIYINLVEHPARMLQDTRTAALVWAPSYKRATVMQASLAVVSTLCGLAAAYFTDQWWWAFAALLIGAVVPFTLIVIMPTNQMLLDPARDLASPETRVLLEKWARLHAVRSLLGLLASIAYLILTLGPKP